MVLGALVGGGKGAETESASCASPRGLWKNSGLHALEVPQFQFIDKVVDVLGVIWSFVGATMQIKVSIGFVREMGYVHVAFGVLYVESQCSWAVV